jgi:hypothetical protein
VFFATVLLAARLILAFPSWSRFADLGDFLRRMRIGSRAGLFVAVAAAGVLVAFGTHTPFYRFGVESLGAVFRAIRVPSRGIVLFDLGLGVLAAWGLSRLARGRRWVVAAALVLAAFEYRAFPVDIGPVERDAGPVYRWLAGVRVPGAVIEWPFSTDAEVEYEFRSTAHWKPLVNGYSGFSPPHHQELAAMFRRKADPRGNLEEDGRGGIVPADRPSPGDPGRGAGVLRRPAASRHRAAKLAPITTFVGRDDSDLVFRFTRCPSFDPAIAASEAPAAAAADARGRRGARAGAAPAVRRHRRSQGNDTVTSGAWCFGWALDDSGVAEVRVSFDDGPAVPTVIHQPHPGVREVHPGYPDSAAPGFGFAVPRLGPGPHTLKVILVGRDGGKSDIQRPIVVR